MFKRLSCVVVFAALVSSAFGQIDPKAEPFLEFIKLPQKPSVPTRTADYTLCSTSYDGEAEDETCVRTVMDFVNRRLMSQTGSDDALEFKMIYAGGQARITDAFLEKPMILPKDQTAILERSFNYAADAVQTGGVLPDEVLNASYDGVVKYGEVVSGEQITATVMARSFMLGNASPRKTTMRFIFSKDKRLLAFVSEVPPRNLLHVLENPADPVPMRRFISGKVYRLEKGEPKLSSSQRLTRYRLNPTLNDALFTFGEPE